MSLRSLSICLVTRNAERIIGRALRSVAPLAAGGAEVVVADTGSRDGTAQVARSLGAAVHVIPWQDDFAAAQNQTLDLTTGAWILWLNPDEEYLSPEAGALAGLLAPPDALAYVVRVQEVMDPNRPDGSTLAASPRLVRRHPDARFVGRLHPHPATPLEELARRENKRIYESGVLIRRHAYLNVVTADKLRWATRLLELELRDRPGQLHYLIEYGRNLLRLNDPRGHVVLAEAADQVAAVAEAPAAPLATVNSLLEYLLTVSPEQSRSRITPEQAAELARRWFPDSPPLLWRLAQRAFASANYRDAAALLERLIHLGQSGTYDRSTAFDPSLMGEPAILNLGNCYLRLGEADPAEACFTSLLSSSIHKAKAEQGCQAAQSLRRSTPR